MNPAHIHLMLNHIPLVGIGFVTLLLILALIMKNSVLINISLIFVFIVALWAVPAYLTGEPAEEIVEDMPGVSEQMIEEHEEAAKVAFIFIEVVGGLALLTVFVRIFSLKTGNILTLVTLLGIIIGGGLIAWTANLGGKINHPEIRSDSVSFSSPAREHNEEREDD